jgi:hypothetical protein
MDFGKHFVFKDEILCLLFRAGKTRDPRGVRSKGSVQRGSRVIFGHEIFAKFIEATLLDRLSDPTHKVQIKV